jgi:hypothetical protein
LPVRRDHLASDFFNSRCGGKLFRMAAKKKAKKKSTAKKVQKRKVTPKKSTQKRFALGKSSQRKSAAKRAAKPVAKVKNQVTKPPKKRVSPKKRQLRSDYPGSLKVNTSSADADSQGLSDVERADSESVSELLEEGNTFEAGVVKGVEEADDSDGKEVRTREFPEDDVPEEYLDKD